jgi:hypothetical protein
LHDFMPIRGSNPSSSAVFGGLAEAERLLDQASRSLRASAFSSCPDSYASALAVSPAAAVSLSAT